MPTSDDRDIKTIGFHIQISAKEARKKIQGLSLLATQKKCLLLQWRDFYHNSTEVFFPLLIGSRKSLVKHYGVQRLALVQRAASEASRTNSELFCPLATLQNKQ